MKKILICCVVFLNHFALAQLPVPASGTIQRAENFPSKYVAARNIDIWLPANYDAKKKYAVLYMHDGQNLYDSNTTWNHQSWDVDDVLDKLMQAQTVLDVLVVGIWNGQQSRHAEYFPQKPYEGLLPVERDSITAELQRAARTKEGFAPISDKYLQFMVEELKPYIDSTYSTYTDRAHTFIAGSSMGGLISLYAICEYPKVFGGAACFSTHWPGIFRTDNNPVPDAFIRYLRNQLPDPVTHRIYFDYGDQGLDALYPPLQIRVDEVMKAKGFSQKNWVTRYFPGENHSEQAWNKRLHIPMLFLLGKK
jgi:predicted alpha/beta superfamily hydrolase